MFVCALSSVGLFGLMRCFLACWAVSRLSSPLSIGRWFWLALYFFYCRVFFFFGWRRSCGFWIVLCLFVRVFSSVGLFGLMRSFRAYWAASRLPSPLLIIRWFWLALFCFFTAVICFLLVATLLWILDCICLFVCVFSSVGLFGLMRCFLASLLSGPLLIGNNESVSEKKQLWPKFSALVSLSPKKTLAEIFGNSESVSKKINSGRHFRQH